VNLLPAAFGLLVIAFTEPLAFSGGHGTTCARIETDRGHVQQ
jgi:hypothetical protein